MFGTVLPVVVHPRNDLSCVGWDVKPTHCSVGESICINDLLSSNSFRRSLSILCITFCQFSS